MNNNIFVMCGIPGIGKSTWIKENKKENDIVISRDIIRFSLLSDMDEYFSREDDVFLLFIKAIKCASEENEGINIFVDATQINISSRRKLLRALGKDFCDENHLIAVCFPNDLDKALEQNELRKGKGRTYVPRGIIRRMNICFEAPIVEEGFEKIITL